MSEATIKKLDKLQGDAISAMQNATSMDILYQQKTKYLGKKGLLSEVLHDLKDRSAEERKELGAKANSIKEKLEAVLQACTKQLEDKQIEQELAKEKLDITLPGTKRSLGAIHPLHQTIDRIVDIFRQLGFSLVDGPEVETDFCNFEALNLPQDHVARDMQASLYIAPGILLRTQTSSVQIRTMLEHKPPVKIIAAGAVYRNDEVDATHSPMFHQVEGLYVDKNVTLETLKGTLEYFARELLGASTKIRLRSSFFPFTEPSVEVDCTCPFCHGKGCNICKQSGWIEILGAGMVHPAVYEKVAYPSSDISGFAFGIGVERIAMISYGIDDIRLFYENDIRFLRQFVG